MGFKEQTLSIQEDCTAAETLEINGATYKLARCIFESTYSLLIPDKFHDMNMSDVKKKYIYGSRPQIILTNDDTTVNICLDLHEDDQETLELRLRQYKTIMKKMYPANEFYMECVEQAKGIPVAYFDYKSYARDDEIYTITFIIDVHDKELLGWFSCPFGYRNDWELFALEMIRSIKVYDLEEY